MLSVGTNCRGAPICRKRPQKGQCRHNFGTYLSERSSNLTARPVTNRTYANHGFVTLCRLFFRPHGGEKTTYKRSKVPCCRLTGQITSGRIASPFLAPADGICMASIIDYRTEIDLCRRPFWPRNCISPRLGRTWSCVRA